MAIDGPASAGKSTVAKLVAKRFNYVYCDTGAMYRVVTLAALDQGIAVTDSTRVSQLAREIKISFAPGEPEQRVFLNGRDVTTAIRQGRIDKNVSAVAAIPAVREEMTNQQRQIAEEGGIVMDGRDIGSTVLPNAPVKIFMVATAHERARRRYVEIRQRGSQLLRWRSCKRKLNCGIRRTLHGRSHPSFRRQMRSALTRLP